jgi:branched-chain amino acid transport system substrate-binding protein
MSRRSLTVPVACLLLLASALLLSACGSSSSSTGSEESTATETSPAETAPAEGGGGEGEAASGTPIKIGLITGLTGPFSVNLGQVGNVAGVWEEAVNGSGGIAGAPVEVIVKDDSGEPSKALVAARELVSEGVVAVAGSWDSTASSYHPYLEEHEIPDIGGSPNDIAVETGPGFFPTGGNNAGFLYGVIENVAKAGLSKLAVFVCAEYPTCAGEAKSSEVMAEEHGGVEVATTVEISASAPSYTAQCLQAKQSGADSMVVYDAGPVLPAVIADCQQQGFDVPQFNVIPDTNNEFLENPVSKGITLAMATPSASDTSTPGGKYFNEMIEKYGPQLREESNWNEALTTTWAGLQMFRHVAELGHVTASSTSKQVYEGLYKVKNYNNEGLSPTVTYVKGKGTYLNCWFDGEIKGKEIATSSPQSSCIPDDQAPAILKTFAEE